MQIRCPSRIHGIIRDGKFEVKCASKHCGAGNGTLVFHYFDLLNGQLIETKRYRDPKDLFAKKQSVLANLERK